MTKKRKIVCNEKALLKLAEKTFKTTIKNHRPGLAGLLYDTTGVPVITEIHYLVRSELLRGLPDSESYTNKRLTPEEVDDLINTTIANTNETETYVLNKKRFLELCKLNKEAEHVKIGYCYFVKSQLKDLLQVSAEIHLTLNKLYFYSAYFVGASIDGVICPCHLSAEYKAKAIEY